MSGNGEMKEGIVEDFSKTAEQIGQDILDLAAHHLISVDELMRLARMGTMLKDTGLTEEDIYRALIRMYPVHSAAIAAALLALKHTNKD